MSVYVTLRVVGVGRRERVHSGGGLLERIDLVDRHVDGAGVEQAREALEVLGRWRRHEVGTAGAFACRVVR
jgi:hypothetical protein